MTLDHSPEDNTRKEMSIYDKSAKTSITKKEKQLESDVKVNVIKPKMKNS